MLPDIITDIVVLLFAVGAVLYLGNYIWFQNYSETLLSIVYIILEVGAGVVVSIPNFVKALGKSSIVVLSSLLLSLVYTLTVIVPLVGSRTQFLAEQLDSWLYSSKWVEKAKEIRGAMIATAAKKDDQELEFEDPNDYRDALSEVKKKSKRRLERGETVLSIILGLALLLAPLLNVQVFQLRLFGFNTTLWIEVYLMAITVSIIYRVTILDVLAF